MSAASGEGGRGRGLTGALRVPVGVALVLAVVTAVTYGGRQATLTPPERPVREGVASEHLEVVFHEGEDGTVEVRLADDGALLRSLPPGEGGFMRGVLRPLRRERMRAGVPEGEPYLLERWPDGSLTLTDPGARLHLELAAYGETSVAAFAALFEGRTAPGRGAP